MLPWKDRCWSARRVSRSWKQEADAVTPPTSYTAQVHKHCHSSQSARVIARYGVGAISHRTPPGNPSPSPSPSPSAAATQPLSGGTDALGRDRPSAGGSSGAASRLNKGILPPRMWFQENRFSECSGEELMGWLQSAVDSLEVMALDKEGEDLCLAAVEGGDGLDIDVNGDGEARVQYRRLCSFLAGVRALCVKHGISCGADELEASTHRLTSPEKVVSPPFGVRAPEELVAAVSAAAARTAEAGGTPPSSSDGNSNDDHDHDHDHRWDGWLVFTVAVTLASSEDRPFLCRCALQSVWGEAGLPRTQMIELLSKVYVALRPVANPQASTTGFQAASKVSVEDTWDGTGSYRLRNDLLQCIYALEGYFVRWVGC